MRRCFGGIRQRVVVHYDGGLVLLLSSSAGRNARRLRGNQCPNGGRCRIRRRAAAAAAVARTSFPGNPFPSVKRGLRAVPQINKYALLGRRHYLHINYRILFCALHPTPQHARPPPSPPQVTNPSLVFIIAYTPPPPPWYRLNQG